MDSIFSAARVEDIVARAEELSPPTAAETEALVALAPGPAADALFKGAAALRDNGSWGIFLYGFVYLSTYCKNNCAFCNFRSELSDLPRYRKSLSEIVKASVAMAESGVHLIDLTMGEDERFSGSGFSELLEIISAVSRATNLPIMLSPGKLSKSELRAAREAGADWYALYQETHNRELFKLWRRGQDFDKRMEAKREALSEGLLVEEGLLLGAGAKASDLAKSVSLMGSLPASQLRAMTYVPSPGGLKPDEANGGIFQELLTIAALRLSRPDALIPASLDVEGLSGLAPRMRAGANVVTSLVPSGAGFSGVASKDLDIENLCRGPERVSRELEDLGLKVASAADYRRALEGFRLDESGAFGKSGSARESGSFGKSGNFEASEISVKSGS